MDIVEEENEEFCTEILEYVDKHHHVILIMDILDKITTKIKGFSFIYYLNLRILTVNIPGRNNFSHCNDKLLFILTNKKKKYLRQEINLEHLINNTLYSSNEKEEKLQVK